MLNIKRLTLSLFISLATFTFLFAQNANDLNNFSKEKLVKFTEKKYGLNDLLVRGIKYQQKKPKAKGTPFFVCKKSETKVFIKGQSFENVEIKYNIFTDELILTDKSKRQLILNSTAIDSFSLANRLFINLNKLKQNSDELGYFEKIHSGNVLFLKKYTRTFIKIYSDKDPFGKFSSVNYSYYIFNEENLMKVDSKKEFLTFFNTKKKEVKKYMKKNRIKYKNATNEELSKLMNFCYAK